MAISGRVSSSVGMRQKLAPLATASSADDDAGGATAAAKPIDVIILDSLAAYVPRFNRGGEHSTSQRGTAAWRRDRTRGATLKSRTSSLRSIGASNDHTDS